MEVHSDFIVYCFLENLIAGPKRVKKKFLHTKTETQKHIELSEKTKCHSTCIIAESK